MAETMNMIEISVDKFINEVRLDLEDDNYEPVIGIGKSGVGKTMSIYELTQELGIGFCEMRLVCLTEVDMLGIPVIEDGRTTYASNTLLPDAKRDGDRGILVLDEITSATSTIRAAAYQLLDSKRALGNYKLPEHWKVIALGNGISDGGVYTGMEAAFLSRAVCYRIEPNFNAWKKWALKNKVHPSVIAYLNFDPSKLHVFDPDEMASVFPCPRSWTALSKKLLAREKRSATGLLSTEDVELYAAGAVGMTEASSFAGFYSYNKKTISAEDIMSGKAKASDARGAEPEVIYIVIQSLVRQIGLEMDAEKGDKNKIDKVSDTLCGRIANVVNWFVDMGEYKLDYGITGIKDLVANVDGLDDLILLSPEFDKLSDKLLEFATENNIMLDAKA